MPLIDITAKPEYISSHPGNREMIKLNLVNALPKLLVDHAKELGLDPATPVQGVQVMSHDFGGYDANIPDLWVKIQFTEGSPVLEDRKRIREVLYTIILFWLDSHLHGIEPDDFALELSWSPTNGKRVVDGIEIEW